MMAFDLERRIKKVSSVSFEEGSRLIFMWVKAGQINVKEFIKLNDANVKETAQ